MYHSSIALFSCRNWPAGLFALFIALALPSGPAPALSYIAIDARDGRTLLAHEADAPRHPDTTLNLMLLFAAWHMAEEGIVGLDTLTTVSDTAARQPPPRIGLEAGEVISVRRLIEIVAGYRPNDAAFALAEALAGSAPAMTHHLNALADQMCLSYTNLASGTGLRGRNQVTVAQDLAIIARHLVHGFPETLPLFSVERLTHRDASRRNSLHSLHPGLDGFVTTFSTSSGYGGVFTSERDGIRLIFVILGARDPQERRRTLAQMIEAGFASATPEVPLAPPRFDGCPLS